MAVSPLAQIDWDNLAGEDSNVVMDLLQRAFNERMYISHINNTGTNASRTRTFFPFPDGTPVNNFQWGEFGGTSKWSLTGIESSNPSIKLISRVVDRFADMTYINANLGTTNSHDFLLSQSKVFGYVGITDWPAVDNPNVTDLRAWYDILLLLTHVVINATPQDDPLKTETEGLYNGFDVRPNTPFGDFYDESSTGLAADWAQLYSGPVARAETNPFGWVGTVSNSGFGLIGLLPFNFGDGDYQILALKAYWTYNNQNLTDSTYTRLPEEVVCYGSWSVDKNNGPVPGNTANTDAYLALNDIVDDEIREFPITSVYTAAEKEVTIDVGPFTLPPAFSDQVNFAAGISKNFFEKWNDPTGATGFEFYTP